ncbi:hypothetical protein RYZ26_02780 [Terasakiella sp. A23]|uniref:hypothetical protein n=1 Tax=Terasakiella sp. FCG-A23 TaxID=3080561 RepID=UPI0029541845|nr:hypothetical protein [Terasakiella sp. A23]MDV7338505.1 hypothetical protein [Terasakiella sp. A23]
MAIPSLGTTVPFQTLENISPAEARETREARAAATAERRNTNQRVAINVDNNPQPQRTVSDPTQIRSRLSADIAEDIQRGIIDRADARAVQDALDNLDQIIQDNVNATDIQITQERRNRNADTSAQDAADSTRVAGTETSTSSSGIVTETTLYANGAQDTSQYYLAAQDLTRPRAQDQSALSTIQESLQQSGQDQATVDYANRLLSQNRLDIVG